MHEPQAPTLDEHGSEVHPAFGAIRAARISSNPGAVLFDSEITHSHTVRVTVSGMSRGRDLNHDWLHADSKPLLEVEMSEAQWASFVSSMNTSAVPCTIRAKETDWNVPGLEFAPRLAVSAKETREAATRAFSQIKAAMAALEEAQESKAGAKVIREKMRTLHYAIENAPANVEFASESLTKHTENVVQKARVDIEAMVVTHAKQIGIDPADVMLAISATPAAMEADQ